MTSPHKSLESTFVIESLSSPLKEEVQTLFREQNTLIQLESEMRMKEQTRHVAHKLRNSLATIQALCGSLLQETEEPDKAERLRHIGRQVEQMGALLTDASKFESDLDEEPIPVDIHKLADQLMRILPYQYNHDLKVILNVQPDVTACLPESELHASLYRLLRHAAEALSDNSEGEIQLRCGDRGKWLELTILADAPGRSPGALGKQSEGRCHPGKPLGELLHVDKFVNRLGGNLEYHIRNGGGIQITPQLPRHEPEPID